ncbi:MAG: hypothetical protein EPN20_00610 [Magnetospirillum sp.]|nr:MAG: hypothetical protein EPN20_00610 [Magnetospirillum sp.]
MIQRLTIDAFAATPETAAVLRQVQIDRQLGKSRLTVEAGGLTAAVAHYAETATPQVVVVEEDDPAAVRPPASTVRRDLPSWRSI